MGMAWPRCFSAGGLLGASRGGCYVHGGGSQTWARPLGLLPRCPHTGHLGSSLVCKERADTGMGHTSCASGPVRSRGPGRQQPGCRVLPSAVGGHTGVHPSLRGPPFCVSTVPWMAPMWPPELQGARSPREARLGLACPRGPAAGAHGRSPGPLGTDQAARPRQGSWRGGAPSLRVCGLGSPEPQPPRAACPRAQCFSAGWRVARAVCADPGGGDVGEPWPDQRAKRRRPGLGESCLVWEQSSVCRTGVPSTDSRCLDWQPPARV